MARKDVTTKEYLGNVGRFADVCNYYLFNGRRGIRPEELRELDPTEWMADSKRIHQKERDLLRRAVIRETDTCTIAIIGLENQSDIHYAMPVRGMVYDALNYDRQVRNIRKEHRKKAKQVKRKQTGAGYIGGFGKGDRILPVITLTVYWGTKDWDGARDLYGLLKFHDKELLSYVNNYRLNLIEPLRMQEEDYEKLTTDVCQVFKIIGAASDKEKMRKLLTKDPAYQEIDRETAELMNTFLNVKVNIDREGRKVDMCKAWEEQWEDGRQAGRLEGRREGRCEDKMEIAEKMLRRGRMTLEEISEDTGLTLEEVRELETTICSGV